MVQLSGEADRGICNIIIKKPLSGLGQPPHPYLLVRSTRQTAPFHHTSEYGDFAIIKLVRDSLSSIDEARYAAMHAIIRRKDWGKTKTALQYTVKAEHSSVEVLRELMSSIA
ncbi:hypothetical protein BGZ61DRAFT_539244 [Ilyonectria robusta]|uniref:uncharacterized protein n=1 Tax=Ilyonectria robusta TaxID=1079257 RepID=UPI001E8DD683|nr:uncharacterized protein BGZ61DRAFT_539244 [Ilyonectria robusta]KAH8663216.1 hypothetical protein BGZ61DRAFT_539244 [Ilyonectria robusta]